jgi:hypothetical protein
MSRYVFDVEWSGGFYTPEKIHCIVAHEIDSGVTECYYDAPFLVERGVHKGSVMDGVTALSKSDVLIGHSIISADIPTLNYLYGFKYAGKIVDTLLLSKLLNPDRPKPPGMVGNARHSIEAYAIRFGGEDLKKVKIEDWSVFTEEMLERCIRDVLVNVMVYDFLCKEAHVE